MSRYIDADKLLEELNEELEFDSPLYNEVENKWLDKGIRIAIKDVKRFPTADVAEVRHGEWKKFEIPHMMRCSKCGVSDLDIHRAKFEYCPNCGAKMDGERKEG